MAARGLLTAPIQSATDSPRSSLWDVGADACPSLHQESQREPAPARHRVLLYNVDEGGAGSRAPLPGYPGDPRLGRPTTWWPLVTEDTQSSWADADSAMHAKTVLDWIRTRRADVVAVCEALGWTNRRQRVLGVSDPAALKRRASRAGFPFAELLQAGGGFHIALLSVRPIRVLHYEGSESSSHFERGLLAAETGGVIYIVVHLHAHSVRARGGEAVRVAQLARDLEAEHQLPVAVLGDMNTLSPLDHDCLEALDIASFMTSPSVPSRLREKYLVQVRASTRRMAKATLSGTSGHSVTGGARNGSTPWIVDYSPMASLLAPKDKGGWKLNDVVAGSHPSQLKPHEDASPWETCLGTVPTRVSIIEGVPPEDIPPYRLDYVLGSPRLLRAHHDMVCSVVREPHTLVMSDHFPIECDWASRQQ